MAAAAAAAGCLCPHRAMLGELLEVAQAELADVLRLHCVTGLLWQADNQVIVPNDGNAICCDLHHTSSIHHQQQPVIMSHRLKEHSTHRIMLCRALMHLPTGTVVKCVRFHLDIKLHEGCASFCSCVEGVDGVFSVAHQGAATIF